VGARAKNRDGLGGRIIHALEGRSQTWLCEQTGIPKQTLNNAIVRGSMMHADKAILVSRVLNVSVEWLVFGENAAELRPKARRSPARPPHLVAARPLTFWARMRRFLRGE